MEFVWVRPENHLLVKEPPHVATDPQFTGSCSSVENDACIVVVTLITGCSTASDSARPSRAAALRAAIDEAEQLGRNAEGIRYSGALKPTWSVHLSLAIGLS